MCGLVGVIAAYDNGFIRDEVNVFNDLLYMDALRGSDATGIMYLDKQNDLTVLKEATPSWEFMQSSEWFKAKSELFQCGRWVFGHNRAKTRGENVDKNAHPFVVDDVVLMQNGTYKGDHRKHKNVDVDTEACAHVLMEKDSIEEAMQHINAAYAFVWYNTKDHTLNIIRNEERPLFRIKTKTGTIIFASEYAMVFAACARNGVSIEGSPEMVPPGTLISYDFNNKKKFYTEETPLDIKYKAPVFQAPATQATSGGTRIGKIDHFGPGRVTICQAMEFCGNGMQYGNKTESEVDAMRTKAVEAKVNGTTFTVEGHDMCKLFPHDQRDNSWYMFGKIMDPDAYWNEEYVCWVMDGAYDKLLEYLTSHIFTVTVDYVVGRPEEHNSTKWMSCVVAHDAQVACNLPKEYTHANA